MYCVLVVMGGLGIVELPSTWGRVLAIGLCIAFALVSTVGPRVSRTEPHLVAHFVVQTLIVTALLALGSNAFEAFTFLFFMLSVHAALVLRFWLAAVLTAVFWLISSVAAWWYVDTGPWFSIVFNLGVFPVCALFGYALRESVIAKRDTDVALERLRVAQQQLRELAVTGERNRLARDLHDSVKQQVFATIMQLGAARTLLDRDPEQARHALDDAEQLAQRAGAELNLVIHELRPVELDGKDLAGALRALVADWSRQTDVEVSTRVLGEQQVLPASIEYALFRVTQEALANVARHSRARTAQVELSCTEDGATVMITDDGQGFDPTQPSDGVGLTSMRERVEALGGRLSITSRPGAGTSITVRLEVTSG